jgi:hypothetical protein
MAPTLLAVTEATVIARRLGAPSIYSARLRPLPDRPGAGALAQEALATLDRPDAIPDEELDVQGEVSVDPGEAAAGDLGGVSDSPDGTRSDGRTEPPTGERTRARRARGDR